MAPSCYHDPIHGFVIPSRAPVVLNRDYTWLKNSTLDDLGLIGDFEITKGFSTTASNRDTAGISDRTATGLVNLPPPNL